MSEADSDKKRNRLGYQRSTIACGHCRRRKIRCVVPEAGPEQRCLNCTRLNKECIFFPVDQQPHSDANSKSSRRTPLPSRASSIISLSPPQQRNETLAWRGQQGASHRQNVPSETLPVVRNVPLAPNMNQEGPFSAPIPQTGRFGPEHLPPRLVHQSPRVHEHQQSWEIDYSSGYHSESQPAPLRNAASMQATYPAYHVPALQQVDTEPFPDPTDIHQMHPGYRDVSSIHSHQSMPNLQLSQQYQQQQQQQHHHQHQDHAAIYGPYPQQELYSSLPQQQNPFVHNNHGPPHFIAHPPPNFDISPQYQDPPMQQQFHQNSHIHSVENFLPPVQWQHFDDERRQQQPQAPPSSILLGDNGGSYPSYPRHHSTGPG